MMYMYGKFVISLDFEKYWGLRDLKLSKDYRINLENVDEVISRLLQLFKKYSIHATWAIVGILFHDGVEQLSKCLPVKQEIYTDEKLNPYIYINRGILEPKQFHFAKDTIFQIANTPYQEIASHTYSHYYCLEQGQDQADFSADLELFQAVSQSHQEVATIVFPRNQINEQYISLLLKYGIRIYRGNEEHFLYAATATGEASVLQRGLRFVDRYLNISGHNTYVLNNQCSISNVKSSRFLAPYSSKLRLLEPLRLNRITKSMTRAAMNREIFHLWWHPHNFGRNMPANLAFLEQILEHFLFLRDKYNMESCNMAEAAKGLMS